MYCLSILRNRQAPEYTANTPHQKRNVTMQISSLHLQKETKSDPNPVCQQTRTPGRGLFVPSRHPPYPSICFDLISKHLPINLAIRNWFGCLIKTCFISFFEALNIMHEWPLPSKGENTLNRLLYCCLRLSYMGHSKKGEPQPQQFPFCSICTAYFFALHCLHLSSQPWSLLGHGLPGENA